MERQRDDMRYAEVDRRLRELVDALSAAAEAVRGLLARVQSSILDSRTALHRVESRPSHPAQPTCYDCGRSRLEVFHTSTRHGYHLCPSCFSGRARRGLARSADPAGDEVPPADRP